MTVDLTNCDHEPIHIPSAIQPHGALLVCTGDRLRVEQASANLESFVGLSAESALRRPLHDFFDDESVAAIVDAVSKVKPAKRRAVVATTRIGARRHDAIVHCHGGAVFVELEPHTDDLVGYHPSLRDAVEHFETTIEILDLCNVAADQVRALTGFDRVMVYRFDRAWNGEVIAESKRADLEPFLGHHYPASDIPVQARRLYTINWLRLIPDAAYRPCAIVPPQRPTGEPLDMSHSVLRSVSPIHCEYLANMGVRASMSISLLRDGQLWGLIACHHYSGPKLVPFALRDSAEFLGQTLSWIVGVRERAIEAQRERDSLRTEAELVRAMSARPNFVDGLATPALLDVTRAEGAAVIFEDEIRLVGATPDAAAVRTLADWLREQLSADDTFVTDDLGARLGAHHEALADVASGVVAVAISKSHREFVLWFRPSKERTISWAGNPTKEVDPKAPRLSPRGSFALWVETVRGKSLPWEPWEVAAASNLRRVILGGVRRRAAELRDLSIKLAEADRMKDSFLASVSHELRTPLTAIYGWARILRGRRGSEPFAHALEVIERNAHAQAQLIEDLLDVSRMTTGKLALDVQPVDVAEVVERALEAVALSAEAKGIRLRPVVDARGSVIIGDPKRLQQVVWNLVTNAVKFTPKGGRVDVVVRRQSSDVEIVVTDSGQGISAELLPHVFESFRQGNALDHRGLGLGLAISRHIVELHGGKITAESDGPLQGATFRVRLPTSAIRTPTAPPGPEETPPPPPFDDALAGIRILLVEDEPDSQDLVVLALRDRGATVVACSNGADALAALKAPLPDVIVSDIGLPEFDGYELIRRIRALDASEGGAIPAVALTAYARPRDRTNALNAGFQYYVAKPVDPDELTAVIRALTHRVTPPGAPV